MEGTETFFHRMAGEGPFFIMGGNLYQFTDRSSNLENAVEAKGIRQGLVCSGSVQDWEEYERARLEQDIFQFKKAFASQAVNQEIRSREEIRYSRDRIRALEFILYDLLPCMMDVRVNQLVTDSTRTSRQVMEDLILSETGPARQLDAEQLKADIRATIEREFTTPATVFERLDQDPASRLSLLGEQVLGGRNVYVRQEQVMLLVPGSSQGFQVHWEGGIYRLEQGKTVEEVERAYQKARANQFRMEALKEAEIQAGHLDGHIEPLERWGQKKEFRHRNIGYVRDDNVFYVYWEVPKFAMQNPLHQERYHPFPVSRVAVRVNASGGCVHHSGAYVIEPMKHPFLEFWDQKYTWICPGEMERVYPDTSEGMAQHISEAVNAFMNGLTRSSLETHKLDGKILFFNRPLEKILEQVGVLTREEAIKQSYQITNERR